MEQSTAQQAIERKRKHPSRWMPGEKKQRIGQIAGEMLHLAGRIAPGFVLCFADMMGIPSGLHAAWMGALAMQGESMIWSAGGSLLALVMRLVWGLPMRLEMLAAAGVMLLAPAVIFGRNQWWLMGWTALSLLPGCLWQMAVGTASQTICSMGSMVLSALSAPVMLRGLRALQGDQPIAAMEERVAAGYLAGTLLCGAGRMALFGMNLGAMGSSWATLCAGMFLGVGPGTMIGLMSGLMMAMQGLPLGLAVALALGGFMAGMIQCLGRRWATCLSFAAGCILAMVLTGAAGNGCMLAALGVSMLVAGQPRAWQEQTQALYRRFLSVQQSSGDGYACEALRNWGKTMADMAAAVPMPEAEDGPRTASWWKCRLCAGCPEDAACTCMLMELARDHAETVWQARKQADDEWQMCLENLRGLGCGRLYYLRESMDVLRREDKARTQECVRLQRQRNMLVTHLNAMAQSAGCFAQLASGESWWDEMSARQLRRALAENAWNATLVYARRVQGYARVCYELQRNFGTGDQAEELRNMTQQTLDIPMQVQKIEHGRVLLTELPLWHAECAAVSRGMDGKDICGDTVQHRQLEDGRYLAVLSDGMGHGENAQRESFHTAELMQLCLDAGYTRHQALTAVNGMLILSSRGEAFATVDMALADLWTGRLTLDKQGAAASWLIRGREMQEITGDGLPLGVVEEIGHESITLRLREGDQLLMMSDGVEDAFQNREMLRDALMAAADAQDALSAAWSLLHSAEAGEGQGGHDDRTVVVLRFSKTLTVQSENTGV